MKRKLFYYAILPVMAFTLIGAGTASAHGFFGFGMNKGTPDEIAQHQTEIFTQQASLLGISTDEIKAAWAQGKSLQTLAQEKGINQEQLQQKMTDLRKQQLKAHLQILVEKGVITQAQADQRAAFIDQQIQNKPGKGHHHGLGRGFGLGL
jgi:hypothetical protein